MYSPFLYLFSTRHTSSYSGVGCFRSPQSLTQVNSWGFTLLPPGCNSNYLEYFFEVGAAGRATLLY
ncbi:hypothetical protein CO704_21290 [Cedecea neteri]|uniref:Uncharacterized protein n=1 Tax=Cedecea neteri TaxID=158822 RepID=A0A291E5X0_9ENTR|nr:hypothetical protein CO704_21290 [Cedecea neteri]